MLKICSNLAKIPYKCNLEEVHILVRAIAFNMSGIEI